jgi:hypothetical protein
MSAATLLAVFLVPVLFVIVERVTGGKRSTVQPSPTEEPMEELHR